MLTGNRSESFELSYPAYYDKVLAGWLGKSLGGVIGAPFENHKQFSLMTEENIWPDALGANDDLDIQVVWLEAMQEKGLSLTSRDLAAYWQDRCWYNFCEYGFFLHNIQRGIMPPLSGTWNNSFFMESEGCPIRSEIWGFVCPGNPQLAADYAQLDGQLDHGGISIEIERFLSAAAAMAFVTNNLNDVIKAGLSVIPPDSPAALAVEDVRSICKQYPDHYDAWRIIIRRYGNRDASKAITNHALLLMALFLGNLDFKITMRICVNSGWDADCTAATAGALLGVMNSCGSLPQDWVAKLGSNLICGIAVKHKTAPLANFASETCHLGLEMAGARNRRIKILNGPQITVRKQPVPQLSVEAEYPGGPVLWNQQPTLVNLTVNNPTAQIIEGRLLVEPPDGVQCSKFPSSLKIAAGGQQVIKLKVQQAIPGTWLSDKNLFHVRIIDRDSVEITKSAFGLGGARQWLAYGPYWDMWDKDKNGVCPYQNDTIICNPGLAGYWSDFFNHYVRLNHAYLDENRLLKEDIADELPLRVESGEDMITERQVGGFIGQACYYFVRTIQATDLSGEVRFFFGRSGPYRMWLDGELIGECDDIRGWTPHEDEGLKCRLTGKPQRLVIKFIRLTDAMSFSMLFIGPGDPAHERGISYIVDNLKDLPCRISSCNN
jgi:ADP-ribosylglycohydrolase